MKLSFTKYIIACLLIFLFYGLVYGSDRHLLKSEDIVKVPRHLHSKVGSGKLVYQISVRLKQKQMLSKADQWQVAPLLVNIYTATFPDRRLIRNLENLGIECYLNRWTPPLPNHPNGFFLAKLPAERFIDALSFDLVRRIDTAEKMAVPHNNTAAGAINADVVWNRGWDGSGVRVAILDSGLDTNPANSDLPASFDRKDYSAYPSLDDGVENTVTGHGTHVTGSVLGTGAFSVNNTWNGGGPYKGMAPDADLIFLKIGSDATGGASSSAMEGAMDDAIDVYNADIITMSYGGWHTYHDGSESTEQQVDACYAEGVPVFISAGNDANDARHYSGTVSAGSETGYIQVNVIDSEGDDTVLQFNLVWYDGASHDRLSLKYYNSSYTELGSMWRNFETESPRGTESELSQHSVYLPEGDGTYYLKVENQSSNSRDFHIYEDWDNGNVTFESPDPFYTVGSPASADYAMAVAAWISRYSWTDYRGVSGIHYTGYTQDDICPFSSRGPRVDGVQKPDITAPGSAILSIRDTDIYKVPAIYYWIHNDGIAGSDTNYYEMQGTSMACPIAAGAAALLLDRDPTMTPAEVYAALQDNAATDGFTGAAPNSTWGYGKLDINAAMGGVLVETKVFLEGPYNTSGDTMSTDLNQGGFIPTTSPYSEDPRTVDSIPDNIVDWILVELRTTATGEEVTSKSVFLHRDGRLVADDGTTGQITLDADAGNYYIVVKHRNHLAIMSANLVSLSSSSSTLYDLTDLGNIYQSGAILLESGIYGLYAGDANGDSFINATDMNGFWRVENGSFGYKDSDMNMDTFVNALDINGYWRINNGRGSKVTY
ncbi:S8 family serine peptidase [bacterium]